MLGTHYVHGVGHGTPCWVSECTVAEREGFILQVVARTCFKERTVGKGFRRGWL